MSALYQIIIVALFAAFIILFLGKTGLRTKIRDWNDEIGFSAIAEMLDCDFCLSFWTCFIIVVCMWIVGYEIHIPTIFCAPVITRYLL